jgi:hypothetical protein
MMTSFRLLPPLGAYLTWMNLGGLSEAAATPRKAPMPSSCSHTRGHVGAHGGLLRRFFKQLALSIPQRKEVPNRGGGQGLRITTEMFLSDLWDAMARTSKTPTPRSCRLYLDFLLLEHLDAQHVAELVGHFRRSSREGGCKQEGGALSARSSGASRQGAGLPRIACLRLGVRSKRSPRGRLSAASTLRQG